MDPAYLADWHTRNMETRCLFGAWLAASGQHYMANDNRREVWELSRATRQAALEQRVNWLNRAIGLCWAAQDMPAMKL